jgi:glutathione synthase/RimK-type ligase-like ATP-grasp enzyme
MIKPRILFRLADIRFSRDFIDNLSDYGVIISRRNFFNRNGIIVNHGNHTPLRIGKKPSEVYVINEPSAIRYCSNKLESCKILPRYYPDYYNSYRDVKDFPVIVKPLHGHHGIGIRVLNSRHELIRFFQNHSQDNYVIQDLIPIQKEYRFNIFDREVYQVSEKIKLDEEFRRNGIEFSFRSLGDNPQISPKFYSFIDGIIKDFHKFIGYRLGSYCLDVLKSTDNDYYLCEINSAYGIGQFTSEHLLDRIKDKYANGKLKYYRVR